MSKSHKINQELRSLVKNSNAYKLQTLEYIHEFTTKIQGAQRKK